MGLVLCLKVARKRRGLENDTLRFEALQIRYQIIERLAGAYQASWTTFALLKNIID
jgi:hypothetical protein